MMSFSLQSEVRKQGHVMMSMKGRKTCFIYRRCAVDLKIYGIHQKVDEILQK